MLSYLVRFFSERQTDLTFNYLVFIGGRNVAEWLERWSALTASWIRSR